MRKFFAVAALIFSSHLYAQDTLHQSALDHVIITTNKYPVKQSQTGKVVTVIDRQTIEQMGGRTFSEIVNAFAGTTINGANNVLGTNQRTSIRGSSDGNVLILVDGIPVYDPSVLANYFDLNFFHTSQIERIEILRGGQSTLYGSDAVAGVINIITRKASSVKAKPYVSWGYGSYHTASLSAGISKQKEKFSFDVSGNAISSGGFSAANDNLASRPDRDGYRQITFRGDMRVLISKNLLWHLMSDYSHYKADIDAAAFTNDNDFIARNKNFRAGTGFTLNHGNGNLKFNYHFNYVNRYYLDDSTDKASFAYFSESGYTGRSHFAELYDNLRWKRFSLLAGMDYRLFNTDQEYHSMSMFGAYDSELGDTASMWQLSPYASLVYHHKGLNVEAGARWNHHNTYGNNFTYTFNPSLLIHDKFKLFANASSAFKTPTLYQIHDPYTGNTSLKPERSTIFEAGAELYGKGLMARVATFYRKTRDAIQYIISDPVFFSGQYRNINSQKSYGGELELNYRPGKWNVMGNYSFTRGSIRSSYSEAGMPLHGDTTYNNLYRVPEHAFKAIAGFHVTPRFLVSTVIQYSGSRLEPIYASAPAKLDDYCTADLSLQYRINERTRVFADLKNITNTRYFDILGYHSRRFNFWLGADIRF